MRPCIRISECACGCSRRERSGLPWPTPDDSRRWRGCSCGADLLEHGLVVEPPIEARRPDARGEYAVCRAIRSVRQIAATGCWVTVRTLCANTDFFSTEVGRPTRFTVGVQAGCRPAAPEGRSDAGGGLAGAGHPAQRGAAVEAVVGCMRRG